MHVGWEALFENHVTPWLRRDAGQKPLRTRRPPPQQQSQQLLQQQPATPAAGSKISSHESPSRGHGPSRIPPCFLPLWPQPDPLSLTDRDREEIRSFAERCGLPPSVPAALITAGASMARLAELSPDEVNALMCSAEPPIVAGLRLRLRTSLKCEFGSYFVEPEPPEPPPPATAAEKAKAKAKEKAREKMGANTITKTPSTNSGGSQSSSSRRVPRVFLLQRPCLLVVQATPSVPVRERPELTSKAVGTRRWGELVIGVAEANGWLEVRAATSPLQHDGGWMLWDGRLAGHGGPLLRPLRPADAAVTAPRRGAWLPWVYPSGPRTTEGEWVCTLPGAAGESGSKTAAHADTAVAAAPTPEPVRHASEDNHANRALLSELASLGGDVSALARLARQDRNALGTALKALGLAKVGHRLLMQKALMEERCGKMPSAADALQRRRDERELSMLLLLAELPASHVPALLEAGVTVQMMAETTLEVVDTAASACANLSNQERLALLDAVHRYVHRQRSLLDEGVHRILRYGETETLAASLAAAAPNIDPENGTTTATGAGHVLTLARAVRGGFDDAYMRSTRQHAALGHVKSPHLPRAAASLAIDITQSLPSRAVRQDARPTVRVCVFSDTFGGHRQLALPLQVDVLVALGGILPAARKLSSRGEVNATLSETSDFLEWFAMQPAKSRVLVLSGSEVSQLQQPVAGARDGAECTTDAARQRLRTILSAGGRVTWLDNEERTLVQGLRIHVAPSTTVGGSDGDDGGDPVPGLASGMDVLFTRLAPAGRHDCGSGKGSKALRAAVERQRPTVHCFARHPNAGRHFAKQDAATNSEVLVINSSPVSDGTVGPALFFDLQPSHEPSIVR